ncbi:hypothetical protein MRX96_037827 [Rhipicephalus microplus]
MLRRFYTSSRPTPLPLSCTYLFFCFPVFLKDPRAPRDGILSHRSRAFSSGWRTLKATCTPPIRVDRRGAPALPRRKLPLLKLPLIPTSSGRRGRADSGASPEPFQSRWMMLLSFPRTRGKAPPRWNMGSAAMGAWSRAQDRDVSFSLQEGSGPRCRS